MSDSFRIKWGSTATPEDSTEQAAQRSAKAQFSGFSGTATIEVKAL